MFFSLTEIKTTSAAPPPPPPPAPIGPRRKEISHYPETKLKNLQWQKLETKDINKTVWHFEEVDEKEFEEALYRTGAFNKIEEMFRAAQTSTVFAEKLKKKAEEQKDTAVKFLSKDKSHSISMFLFPIVW